MKALIGFLKHDITKLTGSNSKSMLTWENLEKLGGSKTYVPPGEMETLIYRPISERMHICAGNTRSDSCQVGMLSWFLVYKSKPHKSVSAVFYPSPPEIFFELTPPLESQQ